MLAGDRGFDVNSASLQRDAALLERARTAFSKEADSKKGPWQLLSDRCLCIHLCGLPCVCAGTASGAGRTKSVRAQSRPYSKPVSKFQSKGKGYSKGGMLDAGACFVLHLS